MFQIKGQYFLPRMFFNSILVVGGSWRLFWCFLHWPPTSFSKLKVQGRNFLFILILSFYHTGDIDSAADLPRSSGFLNLKKTYVFCHDHSDGDHQHYRWPDDPEEFLRHHPGFLYRSGDLRQEQHIVPLFYVLLPMVSPAVVNLCWWWYLC